MHGVHVRSARLADDAQPGAVEKAARAREGARVGLFEQCHAEARLVALHRLEDLKPVLCKLSDVFGGCVRIKNLFDLSDGDEEWLHRHDQQHS